jgi:hypothetical protein
MPKPGHKVEFSSLKYILMAQFDMQLSVLQLKQQILMKLLMIQIGRKQCRRRLRHFIRMEHGILFQLLKVPMSLIVNGCLRSKEEQMAV